MTESQKKNWTGRSSLQPHSFLLGEVLVIFPIGELEVAYSIIIEGTPRSLIFSCKYLFVCLSVCSLREIEDSTRISNAKKSPLISETKKTQTEGIEIKSLFLRQTTFAIKQQLRRRRRIKEREKTLDRDQVCISL